MDLLTLLSLMFATFVYAISPGPGLFAVLATSTRFGPIPAMWLSFGHTLGDIIYVAIAMLTLNALAGVISDFERPTDVSLLAADDFRSRHLNAFQQKKKVTYSDKKNLWIEQYGVFLCCCCCCCCCFVVEN